MEPDLQDYNVSTITVVHSLLHRTSYEITHVVRCLNLSGALRSLRQRSFYTVAFLH